MTNAEAMGDHRRTRDARERARKGIAACVGVLLVTGPTLAHAGKWRLQEAAPVTVRLTHVDRSGDAPSTGLVPEISPRIALVRKGARASANISYGFNLNFANDSNQSGSLTHDLVATGKTEVIEDFLQVDAKASAKLVGASATSGTVDSINADRDGRQSYTLKVSPSFKYDIDNRYYRVVSNNSFDIVDYSGGSGGSTNGSTSNTTQLGLQNGPLFTTFNWDLGVTQTETNYKDRDDTRTRYSAGVGYRLDAQWRINARAGWEDNDVRTDRNDTDGVTWNLGGTWTPNPRTSLTVDYGSRYFGNTFGVRGSHRSRKTTISLDASRDITNRRASRLVDSFFFLADEEGQLIVDPESGQPLIVNLPRLEETDEDYVNTQFRAAVSVRGKRTTVSVTGDIANRKYEVSGGDEDSYGLDLRVSRRLGGDFSASLNAGIDHAEGTANGSSDTYDLGFKLSRKLGRKTSASLDLLHRERDASVGGDSYTENRIGVSITSSFL